MTQDIFSWPGSHVCKTPGRWAICNSQLAGGSQTSLFRTAKIRIFYLLFPKQMSLSYDQLLDRDKKYKWTSHINHNVYCGSIMLQTSIYTHIMNNRRSTLRLPWAWTLTMTLTFNNDLEMQQLPWDTQVSFFFQQVIYEYKYWWYTC